MNASGFSRPYGTNRPMDYPPNPAVNCWAIINRPYGTKLQNDLCATRGADGASTYARHGWFASAPRRDETEEPPIPPCGIDRLSSYLNCWNSGKAVSSATA